MPKINSDWKDLIHGSYQPSHSVPCRSQDRVFIISGVCASGLEGRAVAWTFFLEHAASLLLQYTSGSLLKCLLQGLVGHQATEGEARMVVDWFRARRVEGVERTLAQGLEEVAARARNRVRMEEVAEILFPQS